MGPGSHMIFDVTLGAEGAVLFSVQTHPWLEDPSNYIGLSILLTMTLALAYT